jgi:adenylate cyclase
MELPPDSQFCNKCGTPITPAATSAEYKQVTVLFADVVHSMDIAAAVGAERLREIMAELVERSAAVVKRYGGTVDKFTGDGIMAVFGAPVALEDHAVRACLAALGVQQEATRLAVDVRDRDGVDLQLPPLSESDCSAWCRRALAKREDRDLLVLRRLGCRAACGDR